MGAIQRVEIEVDSGRVPAYLSLPAEEGTHPGMIVMCEIFGVNDNIKNVCMRLADQGYAAMAVDHFHREEEPVTPFDRPDIGLEKRARLKDEHLIAEMRGAVEYLKRHEAVGGDQIGSLGFCLGGRLSYLAACTIPELAACVVYYGGGIVNDNPTENMPVAPVEMTANIQCPVLGHYAEKDHTAPLEHVERIRKALTDHGKDHQIIVYEKTMHGFSNDSKADSYEPKAAQLAWERTLAFLEKHLKD